MPGQYARVAARGAHESQGDAGVTAGGFQDDGVRFYLACLLGGFNHRHANTIFDAAGGIEEFKLSDHIGNAVAGQAADSYQRGIAYKFRNIIGDLHNQLLNISK
jgi:hypothetical protein